jgi:hypothetical protein
MHAHARSHLHHPFKQESGSVSFFIILTMQKVKQSCVLSWLYLECGTSDKQPLLPKLYYFLEQTINSTKHIFYCNFYLN